MLEVYDLRCEYEAAPRSVSAIRPRFSWKLRSDRDGVVQAEYRIEVAADPHFTATIWNSGPVESAVSHLVSYGGPALAQATRYYYRVRVRDTRGEQSASGEPAWFETAPSRDSWEADFVGMAIDREGESSEAVYFRRQFSVEGGIRYARIRATALGIYELWLNGSRVGKDYFSPGWTNYRKRLAYQTWDVTQLLRPRLNVIGAVAGPGWYKGDLTWLKIRNLYGGETAVSVDLEIVGESGETTSVRSDGSWRAAHGPIRYVELYHGEIYDARAEQPGWSSPAFDDSVWTPVTIREFDRQRLIPQDGPPVRKQERFPVQRMFDTPKREVVLDFGQNITGWVQFSVSGKSGDRVVLRHAEVLDAEGNFYTDNLRSAKAQIEYTLRGGERETFEPHFTFHGFRYVQVVEYPGAVDPASFTAVVLHSQMQQALSFECSNELLNRLHHNILWGWKGNALDLPTDCAQRDERLGWTGDAQVFIGTATYLSAAATFFRKWLRDLASEQLPDGGVPFVVPDVLTDLSEKEPMFGGGHSSTGWGDAAVVCPWTVYLQYADLALLREQYPSMKAWVEYIRANAEQGLVWNSGFHFGDWVALDAKEGSYFGATPNDLTATAFYAYSTGLLAGSAEALGESADASEYRSLHELIVAAFRKQFITPDGKITAPTQTAHVLALVFGLVPAEQRSGVARDLVGLISENGGHLTTGFLGTPFICRALAENGHLDAAYELLLKNDYPSWLYQVTKGATTVWEHWDGIKPDGTMWSPNMNSFNHYAYGAIGQWIYSTIGGISPDPSDPGFHTVIFSPKPGGGINSAATRYEGPYGSIALSWKLDGDRLTLDAEVPPNSNGRIILDGVRSGGVETSNAVAFADVSGAAVAEIGSGPHRFTCRWPQSAAGSAGS